MGMRTLAGFLLLAAPLAALAAIPVDTSAVKPGPVRVEASAEALTVIWTDAEAKEWRADFSLDPARPLITSISAAGRKIIEGARPLYDCSRRLTRPCARSPAWRPPLCRLSWRDLPVAP